MNDNELSMTPFWARTFSGCDEKSLLAALGVLAGLLDHPLAFQNAAYAIQSRRAAVINRTTVGQIIADVARENKISFEEITSPSRKYIHAHPRHTAMFRAFTECPHASLAEIGRRLGGKDHTTVLHGVRQECERRGMTYEDAKRMRSECRERKENAYLQAAE